MIVSRASRFQCSFLGRGATSLRQNTKNGNNVLLMDTGQRERERESLKSFFSEKRRRKELYDFSWNCTRNHDQITQQYELEFHKSHVNRTFDRERDGNKNSKLIELDSTSKLNLLEEKFKMSLLNFTIKRQLSIINKLIIKFKM